MRKVLLHLCLTINEQLVLGAQRDRLSQTTKHEQFVEVILRHTARRVEDQHFAHENRQHKYRNIVLRIVLRVADAFTVKQQHDDLVARAVLGRQCARANPNAFRVRLVRVSQLKRLWIAQHARQQIRLAQSRNARDTNS